MIYVCYAIHSPEDSTESNKSLETCGFSIFVLYNNDTRRNNRKAIKEFQEGVESNNSQSPAVSIQINAISNIIAGLGDD